MRFFPLLTTAGLISAFALAGRAGIGFLEGYDPVTREITMWVEPIDWNVHPLVSTPVWAFCAEGNGVEPVNGGGACNVPGPTIHVVKGDTIRLTFKNTHSIAHTVHFHGWHPFASDMNGASLLGDSMVGEPGSETVIEWAAKPSGSFIYHCHFQTPTHMDMGMYGAFIVDDPEEEEAPDHDFVAVLDEWAIREDPVFLGNVPAYNFFTINGKSFPLTEPWIVNPGDKVRFHIVNAGFEFHSMHLHGYTPDAYEGVAGPANAVRTDVRTVAPGQTVVMDFDADREGVWLFHDHVVPRVTAASDGHGFGAYPRGMLTVLVVGDEYANALDSIVPNLLAAASNDAAPAPASVDNSHQASPTKDETANETEPATSAPERVLVEMRNYAFQTPELRIAAGTVVTWSNKDGAYHTVTAEDGSFDSGEIQAGRAWSKTFTEPGTYPYYCIPHAYEKDGQWNGMTATIVVE